MSFWWYILAKPYGAYGVGVVHVHNPGAVCEGETGKSQFHGAIFTGEVVPYFYSEYPGAIIPEIAGITEKVGGEPFRRLPEGTIDIGGRAHPNNSGILCLAVPVSQYQGSIFAETAGRSEKAGGEPFRRLPEGMVVIGNATYAHNEGGVCEGETGRSQFCGGIFAEVSGRSEKAGGEPFRRLPKGNVNVA